MRAANARTRASLPPATIGVVGPGRVGRSLAAAFAARGHTIGALVGRDDPLVPLAGCDLVFIAVPDDVIPEVAATVIAAIPRTAVLIHTSGIHGLEALRAHGDRICSIHPAAPVATGAHDFDGTVFGYTCDDPNIAHCEAVIAELGGMGVRVLEADRPRYHAALCHASNHLVALAADAQALLGDASAVLVPLLRATVDNLASLGPAAALTGPVARGDAGTVRAHLAALPNELRNVYRENAFRALALARARGLDPARADAVEAALIDGASLFRIDVTVTES